ncbi:type III polyketide synthase [Nakamurella sp. YIM 132087]|uniref:Type III polyketide synthase n=1 Tax=Nakamurella alba TaxID=2665158 RepID=A0A7K1FNS1_9ACTN|nr:3-oxoacyl-[acyl-carrier-protein] synthase III C-terminal domain-containing protein [Nakamurella alba]MTD15811.1 type III polyketide synthase [Nakamurella alba]
MTSLVAARTALPDHRYPQQQVTEAFAELVLGAGNAATGPGAVLRRIHGNAGVGFRHLALPIEDYPALDGFTAANAAWLTAAEELAARAVADALEQAGLTAADVDLILCTTVTGVAAPSLDARLAGRIGLRPDVKRLPLFGLGCVAGAAGIARIHDHLLGRPDGVALLVAVELCSLTVQRADASMANLVASGLFGDGAAAVVLVGTEHPLAGRGPTVEDTASHLYPDSLRTMGWDVGGDGLKIVLGADVADLVRAYLGADVRTLLDRHHLKVRDIGRWISHPGGPKVIRAIEEELDLPPEALAPTWRSLAEVGNMSSVSVLHVLEGVLTGDPPDPGTTGLLMAMGPGFCSELVLLRWLP